MLSLQANQGQTSVDREFYAIGTFTEHVTRMYKFIMVKLYSLCLVIIYRLAQLTVVIFKGGIENGYSKSKKGLETLQEKSDLLSDPLEVRFSQRPLVAWLSDQMPF